jgi:Zn-dependent M28 family amino/carboxypeptidase
VKKIDGEKAPQSMALASSVAVDVNAEYHMMAPTENVVAMLRGTDSDLKDQYVLVGGHLDHVGAQSDAVWFPGAHDNGSGAATVLAVAEAFARAEVKPKRSLIFALFASEEQGLFGATHMAQNLPVPAEQVTAMFNIDCVGRGEGINLGSGGAFPALHRLARSLDEKQGKKVVGETWYGGGADATPFFRQGIPTIYFHTPGGYDIIHSLQDTPDAIDAELLSAAARLVYATAREVAMGGYEREEPAPREAVAQ